MAEHSTIEWTDATWNVVTGCSVVSPGCTNCYAMRLAGTRLQHHPSRAGLTHDSKAGPVWTGKVRFNREWLDQPLKWKRPRRIFVAAHGDLFADGVEDDWLDQIFAIMALCPQHRFQVLTKRQARMRKYLSAAHRRVMEEASDRVVVDGVKAVLIPGPEWAEVAPPGTQVHMWRWPLANVWLGVSVEDQKRADERIPDLLATPATVRWISAEPLLGPVDLRYLQPGDPPVEIDALNGTHGVLRPHGGQSPKLDWVVVGGESGPGARPMHSDWARSLRDQCAAAGVPFFFKQWGAYRPLTEAEHGQACGATLIGSDPYDRDAYVLPVGKAAAGRLLDGVEHNGMPHHA